MSATAGVAGVAGCLDSFGSQETMQLDFNVATGEQSIQGRMAQWVADGVREVTDGQIDIQVYYNGELGGLIESIENLSSGTIDMYNIVFALVGTQWAPIQVLDAPYMYEDYDHILEVTDPTQTELMAEMSQSLVEETNIRVLGSIVQGTRRLTLSEEPAYNPSDLEGRKVRAVPVDMYFETVNGLGANAVNIDFSELPSALATGSVAGQENPYNVIWDSGLHENQDYVIETNHMDVPHPIYINEDTWQDISEDNQQVFYDVINENKPRAVEELNSNVENLKGQMRDAGLEIIPPSELDMDAFRTSVRSHIRSEFPAEWIERIETIHGGEWN